MAKYRAIREAIERFPAKARDDGRFVKRIRGRLYYFGRGGDRKAALLEYDRVKHALYEGRVPRQPVSDGSDLTLKQLANRFLADKRADAEAGTLSPRTLGDYRHALREFLKLAGPGTMIADLGPDDFASFKRKMIGAPRNLRGHAFNRERKDIVAMFNHALDNEWIDRAVRFGKGFKKFGDDHLRSERRERLLQPDDIIHLLTKAGPQMRAMVLLGINGGFGPTDVATLPRERVDLDGGWIRYRRQKTKIRRDVPLWPITVDSLRAIMRPSDPLVFRTKRGNPWVNADGKSDNALSKAFRKLADGCDLPSATFYDLRHGAITFGREKGDRDAVARIVGHKLPGLDDTYVQAVGDDRLRAASVHVLSRALSPSIRS